jgi:hypothetical protein
MAQWPGHHCIWYRSRRREKLTEESSQRGLKDGRDGDIIIVVAEVVDARAPPSSRPRRRGRSSTAMVDRPSPRNHRNIGIKERQGCRACCPTGGKGGDPEGLRRGEEVAAPGKAGAGWAVQAAGTARVPEVEGERAGPQESNQCGGDDRSRQDKPEPRYIGAGHGREWPEPQQRRCRNAAPRTSPER